MLRPNEIARLHGNEITLNADHMAKLSDAEILRIVRHELNHYLMDQYMAFHRQARERVRSAVLSGELTPMDETGQRTSEEIYADLLAEDQRIKENAKKNI